MPAIATLVPVHASGAPGPTSAAIGLPIILVLVAVVVIGGVLYAVLRRR